MSDAMVKTEKGIVTELLDTDTPTPSGALSVELDMNIGQLNEVAPVPPIFNKTALFEKGGTKTKPTVSQGLK
jgi:hypothetical protein